MTKYLTVPEFAFKTNRPTNQIYDLIKKGNSVRRLTAKKINGKWMVLASEIEAYPFNPIVAVKQVQKKLEQLEKRLDKLEEKED